MIFFLGKHSLSKVCISAHASTKKKVTIFWIIFIKGYLIRIFSKPQASGKKKKKSFLYQKLPSWDFFFFQNDRFGKQELSTTFPLQEQHHKTFIKVKQCSKFVLIGSQFQCFQVDILGLSGHCGLCFFFDSFMVLSQHFGSCFLKIMVLCW